MIIYTKGTKTVGFVAGLVLVVFLGFSGIELFPSTSRSSEPKNTFSREEVSEFLNHYIPRRNLLSARYMVACRGTDADIKSNCTMLKQLGRPDINVDQLTDEEIMTICYFLGQLTV